MDFHGPAFVIALVAMSMGCWVITSWIRAKHGYPLTDDWGRKMSKEDPQAARQIELLSNENEKLSGKVTRLEERIANLERIATDEPARLGYAIDNLRN